MERLDTFQSSDGANPPPAAIDTRAHRGLLPQAVEHTPGLLPLEGLPGAELSHHEKLDIF